MSVVASNVYSQTRPTPALERVDLGEIPYQEAMGQMERWVADRREGKAGDRLFLLNHPAVITYGRRTEPGDLPTSRDIPVLEVDRGGYATYHGPGQLVGYLVVSARDRGPGGVVRWVERSLIEGLGELGFDLIRRETPPGASSLVGVWTRDGRKVCSIGMRIRAGLTSHGFAVNIDPDLAAFRSFTVCGLPDVEMTSLRQLAAEASRPAPSEREVRDAIARAAGALTAEALAAPTALQSRTP
jgi:lipoyl(octanoyl) transferase